MKLQALLIANRGEIALRIARAAAQLGIRTVAVYSQDDAHSLHVRRAEHSIALQGVGPRAYLDAAQLIQAARSAGCDAIHPGYGFLSESAAFALACREAGLCFVGPRSDVLELFGDKTQARALARRLKVPVSAGTFAATSVEEVRAFMRSLDGRPILIKASGGGGGRGMRVVANEAGIVEAHARCQSEALAAFGSDDVYVEEYFTRARHLEVQVVGDATGAVSHLWERECTLQRRHQKLIEIAPSPGLSEPLRAQLLEAALRMAREVRYDSLGTFEFLVDAAANGPDARFVFIEANARLQVEHTITEEILGIDLVQAQLQIAGGATLEQLRLRQSDIPMPRGIALQARVNMETMQPDGSIRPAAGKLQAFEPPGGRGIRVDTFGYAGYSTSPNFDSLLAKVIVSCASGKLADVAADAHRALDEFRIEGVATNIAFLQRLLRHADLVSNRISTRFIEEHIAELVSSEDSRPSSEAPSDVLRAPLPGTIGSIEVRAGDAVRRGQQLLVMDSMKMEHVIAAPASGHVRQIAVVVGDSVFEGAPLLTIEAADDRHADVSNVDAPDLDAIRADLALVMERQRRTHDAARPEAVARRHATGQRTARENIADLCDAGTFVEYGALAVAAQRARRSMEELIDKTPADGMVCGIGRINGECFGDPESRAVVMAYDYTVLAGTQGVRNHVKTDRMLEVARENRLPVVIFCEGGGGRPGDTEKTGDDGSSPTFGHFAELSGLVPTVGIASGRCFAGNAALLGCCDVVIATANANIGMGGPAMIEGGGLGVYAPEEIGPIGVQLANGVVDVGVADEAEAVQVARRYLAFFQGRKQCYEAADQRLMRQIVPENRLRVYEVRNVIETLADTAEMLELRSQFGRGMITSLIRVEGRSMGVIANDPRYLGGAIDSDGADKASRFMQLCDAHDIPLLFLCDTPGIMVGPEVEKTALVRHSSRMFLTGATLTVPFFTLVLRKAYGLGALAMSGGSFKRSVSTVAWPTGEFGGMGLEGAVKLAYRNELAQIEDAKLRRAKYDEMVACLYEQGKALSISSIFGLDDTIDPADTRKWLATLLSSVRPRPRRDGKKRPAIDAW